MQVPAWFVLFGPSVTFFVGVFIGAWIYSRARFGKSVFPEVPEKAPKLPESPIKFPTPEALGQRVKK